MNYKICLNSQLNELKIRPKYLGGLYLQSTVLYVFENINTLKSLSRLVYPVIAQKYDSSVKSVEKAIENVIRKAHKLGGMKINDDNKLPTNKEVITFIVSKLSEASFKNNVLNAVNFI